MSRLWSRLKPHLAHARDRMWAGADAVRYPGVFCSLLSHSRAAESIRNKILSGEPFALARMGRTESRLVGEYCFRGSHYSSKTRYQAHQYSGIFPVEPWLLDQFAYTYTSALKSLDILAFWPTEYQAALIRHLPIQAQLVSRLDLEPFLWPIPWSSALAGKRVLIVHPFRRTILSQYLSVRERLFADPTVLPEFHVDAVAAPQCVGGLTGGYASWLDAYAALEAKVLKTSFDVAIIGCGAFGLPLAAAIRKSDRQALHLAGVTQLLFGVTGRRWLEDRHYQHLFNDAWVRPSGDDMISVRQKVDGACYW